MRNRISMGFRSAAVQADGKLLISGGFLAIDGATRPYVARLLEYLLPVNLPTLQRPVRSGGNLQLAWDALSGVKYQLQTSTNLTLAIWQNLNGSITATNTTVLTTDTIGPDKQRFYRVKLVP